MVVMSTPMIEFSSLRTSFGAAEVALGMLLDQPLEQADGEGDARRLDGLQVDRGEQGVHHLVQRADPLARRSRQRHGIGRVAEIGDGRRGRRDVENAVLAYRHDARSRSGS